MIDLVLRPMAEGDQGFVLNSWLKSLWRFNPREHWIGSRPWHAHWHSLLERLASPGRVQVACSPQNAWQIFGWVCSEGQTLHYVFVKEVYRENGIARRLLESVGNPRDCTLWTPYAEKVQDKLGWRSRPSLLGDASEAEESSVPRHSVRVRQVG